VQGGTLECPYHGWRFAADGHCVAVPAVPGFQPPAAHGARAWRVQQRHGLLWVAGQDAADAEPFAPAPLDELPAKRVLCGPFDVATSAPRVVENFLDTAHFGFVHEGWLGARDHVEVPAYEVQADALGRPGVPHYRAWQPQASSTASGGAWVDYRYQLLSPLSALLHKQGGQGATEGAEGATDEAYVLWTSPTGRESCRAWFTIATSDPGADDDVLRQFQQTIFAQDQPVLESQRPRELPVSGGEVHSAADRFSAAYRRWMREIGFTHGCC
jgi:phenylpropionate dioxygenase-like ring-hydroxylating dioxygenase large terminal subunit